MRCTTATKKFIALRAIALNSKMFFFIRALHWYVTMMCIFKSKEVIALRALHRYDALQRYDAMRSTIKTKKVIALKAITLNLKCSS